MKTLKKMLAFARTDKAYKMSLAMGVTLFIFMVLMEFVYNK